MKGKRNCEDWVGTLLTLNKFDSFREKKKLDWNQGEEAHY